PGDAHARPAAGLVAQLDARVDTPDAVDHQQPCRARRRRVDRLPLPGGRLHLGVDGGRVRSRRRLGVVREGRIPGVDGDLHGYSRVFSTWDPLASLTIRKRTGTRSARSATCVTSPTVRSLEIVNASSVVATASSVSGS